MKDGLIKTAAAAVEISVADVRSNARRIIEKIEGADAQKINLLVLPELCLTGYTCGDLFFSERLLSESNQALEEIAAATKGLYPVTVLGAPLAVCGKLYNCAVVLHDGKILGAVPKMRIPNYGEFYEKRHFAAGDTLGRDASVQIGGETFPVSSRLLFQNKKMTDYCFGIEICEDLWAAETPSAALCQAGAVLIANPSASDELIGKSQYRKLLVSATSARLLCGYIYASSDSSESTQDMVYSRHALICENGKLLAENKAFEENAYTVTEIDIQHLMAERRKNTSFAVAVPEEYCRIGFAQELRETTITRLIEKNPFVPDDREDVRTRAESILAIQSQGLKKRLEHTKAKSAVIGVSGGLDSTLALLVAVRAMALCHRPLTDVIAVTMPCFGTTRRTKSNAVRLCEELGVTLKEIDITKSVLSHFADIGQDPKTYDVIFENAQARERTQVLMDLANMYGGLVIGTGDLSELALGWATYNGDHMSMYGVNASVPKTLVRYIVHYESIRYGGAIGEILEDILDTPVSPELLPVSEQGEMTQKTEDLVGPYELHDFFLYHMLRFSETPAKILRLAKIAYQGVYPKDVILHWLQVFIRRFFAQQFKRSCIPDGPKVGSVTLSPRGDWRMPSDASAAIWLSQLEGE